MEIRPTTDQDLDVFVDTVHAAFGLFPETPVEGSGLWWLALGMDRCLLALTADGRPVGTAAAHSFELTLPGETLVPAAGVTAVGVPDGYASYVVESGTLTVDETIATDDAVFTAVARFVLGHDLVSKVVFKHVPPGHPLRWQFADLRAGEVSGGMDWLWVRLLDVPRALTARGWFTNCELVLDIDDPFLGERGRYLLPVQNGKADCVLTDRKPDLSLDVRDLGSVYPGGAGRRSIGWWQRHGWIECDPTIGEEWLRTPAGRTRSARVRRRASILTSAARCGISARTTSRCPRR